MEQEINGARSMQHAIPCSHPESAHTGARQPPHDADGKRRNRRSAPKALTQCGTPLPSFALLFHAARLVRHWADPPDDADDSGPAAAAPQCTVSA
jgi:hypothetical protein